MSSARVCWVALGLTFFGSTAAHAVDVERVAVAHVRALGGRVDGPAWRYFLQESQAKAWPVELPATGCVGFLAFGRGQVRDVDLALYSSGGLALDEDETVAPYAYVRACADERAPGYLRARMFSGTGELLILRVDDAPRSLGVLPESLGLAAAPGGRLEPPRDVGPGPRALGVGERLARTAERLAELGYQPAHITRSLRLFQGVAVTSMRLRRDRCYLIVAVADRTSRILLEAVGPFESRWLARGQGSDARLAICAREGAEHSLRVRSRPRRAIVRLAAFEHSVARSPEQPPDGAVDAARLALSEARHRMAQVGLEPEPFAELWAEPGTTIETALRLPGPGCYSVAAVSPANSRVDLRVTDARGRLIGRDDGRTRGPMAYFCTDASAGYNASIRSASRAQRVTLLLGRESR